jgi:hypothetical protein
MIPENNLLGVVMVLLLVGLVTPFLIIYFLLPVQHWGERDQPGADLEGCPDGATLITTSGTNDLNSVLPTECLVPPQPEDLEEGSPADEKATLSLIEPFQIVAGSLGNTCTTFLVL